MDSSIDLTAGSGLPRAKVFAASVPTTIGFLTSVSRYGLLAPVSYTATGTWDNFALDSPTGAISATSAMTGGQVSTLTGTATGADGVVLPWTGTLTAQVTVPDAPTLSLASVGNGSVVLNWTDGATGGAAISQRMLYTGTVTGGEGAGVPVTVTAGQVTISGLTNAQAYFFKGAAVNSVGTGPQSSEVTGTPTNAAPASVPAAPTISLTAGDGQITLAWVDGSNGGAAITSHKLYRGTASGGEVLVGVIVSGSPYVDTGLSNGVVYYYRLSAVNSAGESAQSNEALATPASATAGANDILLYQYGQSNVGSQGTQGLNPPDYAALAANTNIRIWNSGPSGTGASWQPYQIGVNSNPIMSGSPVSVTAVSWSGGTVTLTAPAHGLAGPSQNVTVYGMTPAALNGVFAATVVDANTITFALASNPGAMTVAGKVTRQQYWGREAQFLAYYTAKYPNAKIDLIKYGPGGAQLADDAGGTPTLLPGATLNGTKHWPIFTGFVTAAKAAGLNVRNGFQTVFLFDQGETDAQDTTKATAYAANGNTLVDGAISALNPDVIIVNQMFGTSSGVSGSLTTGYPYCDQVRAGHASMVTHAGSRGILIDDASAWTTSGIHYPPSSIDGPNGTAKRLYEVFALPDVTQAGSITGTAQVGQTLTYTPAAWNYTPTSIAYQWNADGVAISGATSLTYSPGSGDVGKVLTVTETATARLGTKPATCTATSAVAAASSYDAATVALVNAAVAAGGSAPTGTREAAIDTLIAGLKADGIWAKGKALEIIAGHDETFAQMEWFSATKKVSVFHGSPTFVTDRGYTLNGTDQSLDTGLNPTTLGLAQNSVGFGLWIAAGTGTTAAVGVNGAVAQRFNVNKGGSGALSLQCSAAAAYTRSATGAPARATHHTMRRAASGTIDYLNNGALDTAGAASTSGSVQNSNILLGQTGTTPTYAADRYFALWADDGTMSNADYANLHSRLSTYKTTLGA